MLFDEINPFLRYVRYMSLDKDSRFYPHVPYDSRFFYTAEGSAEIEISGTAYKMDRGCALFIPAGTEYLIKSPAQSVRYFAVNFDYTRSRSDISIPIPPEPASRFNKSRITERAVFSDLPLLNETVYARDMFRIEHRCAQAEHEYTRRLNFYDRVCSSIFSEILFEFARCIKVQEHTENADTIDRILDYIHRSYSKPITNESIGNIFSFHPNYISDMVKQSTGMPLHRYITHVRIINAIAMLDAGGASIADIAGKCGFQNIYYFSRYFKKTVGVSPSKYLRK